MDCLDGVLSLVVADKVDFVLAGLHQRYNLPWSPHKRLAEALELNVTGWVDHLDHSTSLRVEQHPIIEVLTCEVIPTQDGNGLGVEL